MLEKDTLASQGFDNWNKRDFTTFIKGCEKYGRKEEAQIAAEMEGKSLADVKEYCQTFWARYTEILGHEKIIENIERGEAKLAKNAEMQDHLLQKVNSYRNPLAQLRIQYTQNKGKHWTEEEDRFLVNSFHPDHEIFSSLIHRLSSLLSLVMAAKMFMISSAGRFARPTCLNSTFTSSRVR